MSDDNSNPESPTTQSLISNLRSSFFATEFESVTKKVISREETLKKENNNLKTKYQTLEKKHKNEMKKKESEINELKNTINGCEKRFKDLSGRVLCLEKLGDKLMMTPQSAENSRQPLVNEKEKRDSNIKIETKFPEIIQLDDDDDDEDDDDDHTCISILKRKKVSNEKKKEFSSDDDDTENVTVFKRKRALKETKGDINEDFIDKISTVTQKSENLEELRSPPITSRSLSTPSANNNPILEKHEPKKPVFSLDSSDNSGSDDDTEKIDEAYMSLFAKLEKQKERWKSEEHMVKEFEKDDELCMNAVCALHRQKIILYGPDISRVNYLARSLWDPQGKLKKTASELNQDDRNDIRKFARMYATQIFRIYEAKKDHFFPPSRS